MLNPYKTQSYMKMLLGGYRAHGNYN